MPTYSAAGSERPYAGTFSTRFVKRGPEVPVKFAMVDGRWQVTVNGDVQPSTYTPEQCEEVKMLWVLGQDHPLAKLIMFARPIPEEHYDRLIERLSWCRLNEPLDPCLHPFTPIDLTKIPHPW